MKLDALTRRLRRLGDLYKEKSDEVEPGPNGLDLPSYKYGYQLAISNACHNNADAIDEIDDYYYELEHKYHRLIDLIDDYDD